MFSAQMRRNIVKGASIGALFVACMMLPLVGRAAAITSWYHKNVLLFAGILVAGLAASAGTLWLARKDAVPPGRLPYVMNGIFVVLLLLLVMGRFKL